MIIKHRINNMGWIWNGDEIEGWNEANQRGMLNIFQSAFSQSEEK
jgi:hypothetical protein